MVDRLREMFGRDVIIILGGPSIDSDDREQHRLLDAIKGRDVSDEDRDVAESLITLAERERIDLRTIGEKEPLALAYDVVHWRKNKFKGSLRDLKMPAKSVKFSVEDSLVSQIGGFNERFAPAADKDFYYAAMDFITPRSILLHSLTYDGE